ncbi:SDR family oxidoreductase [Alcaligenaceae bacterium LF4-65]|jgi:NAD(P)-dependent dehydrogenase (short-subunit alcohol dehydrogenase family)|uniref:SDR family oxidoreductase n=1 Tax=Zwartia hollandica TaxID=324606 RepID=A0A953T258_9BURK|nr:SDR family oxidoreductase [Zwartia hollandica]MBZ1351078.1 SDR family oxidoreductase [Zwartia hollandica]
MSTDKPRKDVIIVTGGGRGIGAEVVEQLAKRDVPVCFSYVSRDSEANALVARLQAEGYQCAAIKADVGHPADIEKMFKFAQDKFGVLGGLVNNAGYVGQVGRKISNVDLETLHKTFDVNVIGPILCAQHALKQLSTAHGGKGGKIINVSSIAARTGSPNDWVDYAASKAALNTFTLGLAREVAKEGVQVIGVAPGGVATELHAQAGGPGRIEKFSTVTPIGRAAHPSEIADVVVWALLDAPCYITGTTIDVAGGL